MTDEKKYPSKLSRDDLKEVKGGIPYEKPDLLELTRAVTSCTTGKHCDNGHNGGESCDAGLVCSSGTHGDVDTTIEEH